MYFIIHYIHTLVYACLRSLNSLFILYIVCIFNIIKFWRDTCIDCLIATRIYQHCCDVNARFEVQFQIEWIDEWKTVCECAWVVINKPKQKTSILHLDKYRHRRCCAKCFCLRTVSRFAWVLNRPSVCVCVCVPVRAVIRKKERMSLNLTFYSWRWTYRCFKHCDSYEACDFFLPFLHSFFLFDTIATIPNVQCALCGQQQATKTQQQKNWIFILNPKST